MIRLENITKIYNEKVDDTKALDDVSLKIEDGEFISVMGASGSGKSTLLKIIGCMDTPTAGKYFLDAFYKPFQLIQIHSELIDLCN